MEASQFELKVKQTINNMKEICSDFEEKKEGKEISAIVNTYNRKRQKTEQDPTIISQEIDELL